MLVPRTEPLSNSQLVSRTRPPKSQRRRNQRRILHHHHQRRRKKSLSQRRRRRKKELLLQPKAVQKKTTNSLKMAKGESRLIVSLQLMVQHTVTLRSLSEVAHSLNTSKSTQSQSASSPTLSLEVPTFHAQPGSQKPTRKKVVAILELCFVSNVKMRHHLEAKIHPLKMLPSPSLSMVPLRMSAITPSIGTTNQSSSQASSHKPDQRMVVPQSRFGVKTSSISTMRSHAVLVLNPSQPKLSIQVILHVLHQDQMLSEEVCLSPFP